MRPAGVSSARDAAFIVFSPRRGGLGAVKPCAPQERASAAWWGKRRPCDRRLRAATDEVGGKEGGPRRGCLCAGRRPPSRASAPEGHCLQVGGARAAGEWVEDSGKCDRAVTGRTGRRAAQPESPRVPGSTDVPVLSCLRGALSPPIAALRACSARATPREPSPVPHELRLRASMSSPRASFNRLGSGVTTCRRAGGADRPRAPRCGDRGDHQRRTSARMTRAQADLAT